MLLPPCFCSLHLFLVPKPLPFFLGDLSIAYPLYNEHVPIIRLFVISFLVPAFAILCGHGLQHLRSPSSTFKNLFVSYLWCLLGVFQAMGILFTIVNFLKLLTGRQRPNFLSLCDYNGYRAAVNAGGKVLQHWYDKHVNFGQLGDIKNCQGTLTNVADSLRSFPSGHSAISWSSMVYTTLYLRSALGVPKGVSISIPALVSALPLAISAYIAMSRVIDRWHNTDDVAIGSAVGIISGFLGWGHYLVLRKTGHAPVHGAARLEVEARARDRMKAFASRMIHGKGKGIPTEVAAAVAGAKEGPSPIEKGVGPVPPIRAEPVAAEVAALSPSPSPEVVTPHRGRIASKLLLFVERMFFRPRPLTPAIAAQQDPLAVSPEEEAEERELQRLLEGANPEYNDESPSFNAPPTPVLSHLAGGRSVSRGVSGEPLADATYGQAVASPQQPTSLQQAEDESGSLLAGAEEAAGKVARAVRAMAGKGRQQQQQHEDEEEGKAGSPAEQLPRLIRQDQQQPLPAAPQLTPSPISVTSMTSGNSAPPPMARNPFAPAVSSPLSGSSSSSLKQQAGGGRQPKQPAQR
jgi:membrane-associated phospholipid phosphatase